jgi:glycosyltransferase involved in cell wall biosynthesis
MKVCMFTNTYIPHVGGVARSVDWFAQDLRILGHQVLVVAPTFPDKISGEQEEVLRVPAIQHFNGSDFSLRISLPFIISNRINEFRPDVIHSHHPYLLGDAALRTARRQGCPLIFTHHTLYEKYTHYVPLDSETLRRFVISLSTRYANLCDGIVAPSRSLADLIRERGVARPIREIPTGVDLGFFKNGRKKRFLKACGIQDQQTVIGHVGRLAPEKNLQYLAQAVALFLKKNAGVFLVVGEGPSKEEIHCIFESEGLTDRLFLAGERTGQELADAYQAMDIFVFASRTETQGMVLVEAMAAGKPVIALDASGVREVVEEGRNGRLLKEDARQSDFAKALEDFFQESHRTKQWKDGALKTAHLFSREKCAESLLRFYESVLEDHFRNDDPIRNDDPTDDLLPWGKLLRTLRVEWDLISEKAMASAEAFNKENDG